MRRPRPRGHAAKAGGVGKELANGPLSTPTDGKLTPGYAGDEHSTGFGPQLVEVAHVHEERAMHADESGRRPLLLELADRNSNQV
jgi:hypothetical protein